MDDLTFAQDIRSREPNENHYRKTRFKVGWATAVRGEAYSAETLETLTWQNLGYHLGTLLGPASEELQEEVYAACVQIQAAQQEQR